MASWPLWIMNYVHVVEQTLNGYPAGLDVLPVQGPNSVGP